MPGACCTRGLVCKMHSRMRTRAYRYSRSTPAFPAQWFYGLCRASCAQRWHRARARPDALGHAATAADRRAAGNKHPQHFFAALARLVKPENRCLVPFNCFAEYAPEPNPETKKKDVIWFAINDDRPLICFAGIWTEFKASAERNQDRFPDRIRSTAF